MADSSATRSFLGVAYIVSDKLITVLATPDLKNWSTIIGIITAICGNILISIALNVQRFAHIRISKEQAQGEGGDGGESGKGTLGNGQGLNGATIHMIRSRSRSTSQESATSKKSAGEGNDGPEQSSSDTEIHDEKAAEDAERKSYLKSPYWWIGITLMAIGEMGNFLAYGFAPASIVAPLGVVALVSNCVIAPIVLHERFRTRDFLGVVIAAAGAVVVVLSAKQQNARLGPHELQALILRWEFALYSAITVSVIAVGIWASSKYGKRTVVIDLGLVGLFGGYTALSTKGIASLLSSTTWHVFTFPITYILAVVLVVTAVMQIRYVNRALQRFSSVQIIPGQYVCFTISVVVGSAVLYRDFETTTASEVGMFVAGCFLTFGGVYLLSSGKDDRDDHGAEPAEHEQADLNSKATRADYDKRHDERRSRIPTSSSIEEDDSENQHCTKHLTPQLSVSFQSSRRSSDRDENSFPSVNIYTGPTADERTPLVDQHASSSSSRPSGSLTPIQATGERLRPSILPGSRTWSRRESTSDRPSLRQTISHLATPLTSPLSASLAAVVADANRRGIEAVVEPARRGAEQSRAAHARAALRRSRSRNVSESTVIADESSAVVLPYDPRESEESPLSGKNSMARVRGVGRTISGLLRPGSYGKPAEEQLSASRE